ncbi:hypothetical protein D3C77_508570 [compost metagenome]
MNLVLQRLAHTDMTTGEGNLSLLFRRQVDANIQTAQLCRLQLDIGRLETLAGQVHYPVHQAFSPATLVHGQRLMQRRRSHWHGIRGFRRGGLGQGAQAFGKVIHTGVGGGTLEVLETIVEQTGKRLVTRLTLFGIRPGLVEQCRQGIDGRLPWRRFRLRRWLFARRMRRRRALSLRALLQRHAQGRQISQRIGLGIELRFCCEWSLSL